LNGTYLSRHSCAGRNLAQPVRFLLLYVINERDKFLNREELDKKIEHWLADQWQCQVDFEIGDALNKLLALKLVNETDG